MEFAFERDVTQLLLYDTESFSCLKSSCNPGVSHRSHQRFNIAPLSRLVDKEVLDLVRIQAYDETGYVSEMTVREAARLLWLDDEGSSLFVRFIFSGSDSGNMDFASRTGRITLIFRGKK